MADWAYAQAVDAMRAGKVKEAMTHLGWALHYIADLTVPQHATDEQAAKPGSNHVAFENECDIFIAKVGFPHATSDGVYNAEWRPGQFGMYAAASRQPALGTQKTRRPSRRRRR